MKLRITLVFSFLATEVIMGHRTINRELTKPLQVGDEVIISGKGISKWAGEIRFEASQLPCQSRTRAVNVLVLLLQSRIRRMQIGKKTRATGCQDGQFTLKSASEIGIRRNYTIRVTITRNGYRVKLGNRNRERVIYSTRNSLQSVDIVRARSGDYSNIHIKRRIELPLVSDCGVRQRTSGTRMRIAGGEDSEAGNYPWQAAIRKMHVFVWNPLAHMCGGTLIDSCWVLTAGHCTTRVRGNEADYYIRVGDFNNSDHAELRRDEDQQDLAIHRVFIHHQYSQSTQNPVNDISLIKLKNKNGPGNCASFSTYVRPACLPVTNSDDFLTNRICEISGWGASAYHQRATDYPEILKKGEVFLNEFEECKTAFGNDSNGETRIREGMICAGGKADTCQGDSGGPLACQRDRARPESPFVIWGVTSWGEKCASKGKPGVYTNVLHYMQWIMDTISMNID